MSRIMLFMDQKENLRLLKDVLDKRYDTKEGICLEADFATYLWERRRELKTRWQRALPLRVASWEKAGWYNSNSELSTPLRASGL